jgi:hypothetical protein
MNTVRDYRNSTNPKPISLTEFKRLINGLDERRFGASWVYVGEDNLRPVIGLSTASLPITKFDIAAVRTYGLSDGVPAAIHIRFDYVG